jgi:hypothetical protein
VRAVHRAAPFWLSLWLLAPEAWAEAPPPARVFAEAHRVELAGHLELAVDPGGQLEFADALEPGRLDFRPAGQGPLHLAVVEGAVWIRFRWVADEPPGAGEEPWLLSLNRPWGGWVRVFAAGPGSSAWRELSPGLPGRRPETTAWQATPAFGLPPPGPAPATVYLRVETASALFLPLTLERAAELHRRQTAAHGWFGLYHGIALAMIALNLIMLIRLRDASYLWYVLYVACLMTFFFFRNGLARAWCWPELSDPAYHALTNLALGLGLMLAGLFARSFLDTRRQSPRLDGFLWAFITLAGLLTLLAPFADPRLMNRLFPFLGMATPLWALGAGIMMWRRGYRPARFFLLAFGLTSLGGALNGLVLSGTLDYSPFAFHAFQGAAALESLLLSLALADRLRAQRSERQTLEHNRREAEAAAAAKRDALAVVSHELRTPMNGVLGMTALLLDTPLTPTQREQALDMQVQARELLGLIEEVLETARREHESLPAVAPGADAG